MSFGYFTYPGIQFPERCHFTRTHGITPSVATITIQPQRGFVAEVGTLTLVYDNRRIQFADCRLDAPTANFDEGGESWTFRLLDRRWRWKFPTVSAKFNVRKRNGRVDPRYEVTPQKMARFLLGEIMGEKGFDVSQLPNDTRPEVDWQVARADQELARLCDSLGCTIVLHNDNRVRIHRKGVGRNLPGIVPNVTTHPFQDGLDVPLRPDALEFVAAPTVYQTRWKLEAVGLDVDGRIKPINKLSYRPAAGWDGQAPETMPGVVAAFGINSEEHELALRTVFRWYRLKEQVTGGLNLPFGARPDLANPEERIIRVDQILPLHDRLIPRREDILALDDNTGDDFDLPDARLFGTFWPLGADWANTADTQEYTKRYQLVAGGWKLNRELGIVEFDKFCVKLNAAKTQVQAADLYLECAYHIRTTNHNDHVRYHEVRNFPGKRYGTKSMAVLVEDVYQTHRLFYTGRQVTRLQRNLAEMRQIAKLHLDAAQRQFETPRIQDQTYIGLVNLDLDGAITQISYSVDNRSGFSTRAGRNTEFDHRVPSFRERRKQEDLEAAAVKREQDRREARDANRQVARVRA